MFGRRRGDLPQVCPLFSPSASTAPAELPIYTGAGAPPMFVNAAHLLGILLFFFGDLLPPPIFFPMQKLIFHKFYAAAQYSIVVVQCNINEVLRKCSAPLMQSTVYAVYC